MKSTSLLLTAALICTVPFSACSPEPYGPTPSESQLKWADMEYYMFCHFGPNTFTGLQWGEGTEDPDIFNPTELDCEQWVKTAIAAGMKGIIITAKHHDGFCLWPSKYSTHTVAQSSWRNGKGDVLRELRDACDKYNFPMGVYISPWDRNHPSYGTAEYNKIFAATVEEVHKTYGPFFEQWYDGANGGANIPSYDWSLFHRAVYDNSPNAVIFSDVGPDCRWVGNENGYVGETNWCLLDTAGHVPGRDAPSSEHLFRGDSLAKAWIPAECDTPIRGSDKKKYWFWNTDNDGTQKSVEKLMDIWFNSVGHGANLILNVAPDNRGKLPAADSIRLMEFREARNAYFKTCLGSYSRRRFGLRELSGTAIKIELNDSVTAGESVSGTTVRPKVKCLVLAEEIRYGQRIKAFTVEANDGKGWKEIARGTTIGHKRILPLGEPVTAKAIRVKIIDSFARPLIKSVEVY